MRFLTSIIILALVGSGANAAPTILNGSFENGSVDPGKSVLLATGDATTITNWKVVGGNVDYVRTAWKASDGFRTVDLSGTGPGGILQTVHGLTSGLSYQVSFDLSGTYDGSIGPRSSPNRMTVSVTGGTPQSYSYNQNNTVENMLYGRQVFTFVANDKLTVLRFSGLDSGNYGAVLDNVAITQASAARSGFAGDRLFRAASNDSFLGSADGAVPEPAIWALMIGGFGLVGSAMRRREVSIAA